MKPWLVAIVAVAACAAAQAQSTALMCHRDSEGLMRPVAFASDGAIGYSKAERDCWLDWAAAQRIANVPDGQWVDVRGAGLRQRLGLPGVAAVELADVSSKAFLKGLSLVLVGTGTDLRALSSQCAQLKQSGQFKDVHVLLHGVRAWQEAGQPVLSDGLPPAADEATAQELWLGASQNQWRLAVLGLDASQIASLPLVPEWRDQASDLRRAVAELARRVSTQSVDSPHQRWLVIAATQEQLTKLRALWREFTEATAPAASAPIWLTGAWPAYASYIEQQKTLAALHGQPLPRLCGM